MWYDFGSGLWVMAEEDGTSGGSHSRPQVSVENPWLERVGDCHLCVRPSVSTCDWQIMLRAVKF